MAPPEPVEGRILNHSGCQNTIGFVIDVSPKDGDVSCWLDIGPGHLNRNDLLHGGIMAMLLDIACGYAASRSFDEDTLAPVLTVSLNVHYVAPVWSGRVTATGKVTGGGRKLSYANGELRDDKGQLIASAAGVFKRISARRAP